MFRIIINFLKVLGIACAIGVLIRVGEVLIIKHNQNNIEEKQRVAETINDNVVQEKISDNEHTIGNVDITTEKGTIKKEEKVEKKIEEKQDVLNVSKETKREQKEETKEETKEEIKEEITNNKQEQIVEEKQENSNTQTLPETTKQEVLDKEEKQIQEEIQTDEKYTEIEVDVAEKKECNGNNHGIGVGNSGKWFNTKDEAIATYKKEIKIWGDKWTDIDNPISDEEYYKNCPIRL